jgi:hypothetical protein
MATRTVNHAAAIFADMSVDGPVIGTLVAIIDRAKNLPNVNTLSVQAMPKTMLTTHAEKGNGQARPVLRSPSGQGSKEDKDRQARRPDAEMVRVTQVM